MEGPRTSPPSIRKGSQNSQPQDEATLAEEQNKVKRLPLPERRGNLPNFWYTLSNEPDCLRIRFLDHFSEPQEFRIYIRKDRCCSNCTHGYRLGKLDKHYLYAERGNSLNARRKKVLELITAWAENQTPTVFPSPSFQPTVNCFLSADQLMQIAKDAHLIMDLDKLRKALGPWLFFQTHGEQLFANLQSAYRTVEEATTKKSRNNSGQTETQASCQSSQGLNIWVDVWTPTLSQSIPSEPSPASTQPVVPTRRPLGMISGNAASAARKRLKRDKKHY